jgi:hypothetical protein
MVKSDARGVYSGSGVGELDEDEEVEDEEDELLELETEDVLLDDAASVVPLHAASRRAAVMESAGRPFMART